MYTLNLGNDIVAMEETLNPHLAFSDEIDDCMKGIKDIVIHIILKRAGAIPWDGNLI